MWSRMFQSEEESQELENKDVLYTLPTVLLWPQFGFHIRGVEVYCFSLSALTPAMFCFVFLNA